MGLALPSHDGLTATNTVISVEEVTFIVFVVCHCVIQFIFTGLHLISIRCIIHCLTEWS